MKYLGHYNAAGHREAAKRFAPILSDRLRQIAVARENRRERVPEAGAFVTASL